MNDDPAEVNVLYAKVHSPNDILQSIADKMSQYFSEIGKKFSLQLSSNLKTARFESRLTVSTFKCRL